MAIQLRRGNEADLDISRLRPGETAVCLDTGKVFVKLAGENYLVLANASEIPDVSSFITRSVNDLVHYYSKAETDEALSGKQNTLVAGSNIILTPHASDGTVTISAAGGSQGSQGEILFDSESGTAVTNVSPSLSFASGKSLSSYTDGYLEVFYRQNAGTNGGLHAARALIHSVSGSVTVEPVQLLGWEYDSANTALALTGCAGTVSNGNTITFSNPENAEFSFTVYRIIGYKAVGA